MCLFIFLLFQNDVLLLFGYEGLEDRHNTIKIGVLEAIGETKQNHTRTEIHFPPFIWHSTAFAIS